MSEENTNPILQTDTGYNISVKDLELTKDRYNLFVQTYVPRPIAWVLTENENGTYNLAPFSYSGAISHTPITVIFSCGMRRGDRSVKKDTWANIQRTKKCVVHIPSVENIEDVNNSGAELEIGTSEADEYHIDTVNFENFPLPRVKRAPVAFGCTLKQIVEVGDLPMGLVIAEVEQLYISEHIVKFKKGESFDIDETAINPLTCLGHGQYGTLGEILDIGPPPKLSPVK